MHVGNVIGTATATVKHPSLQGWKMLVVQLYGSDGHSPDGEPILVVDALGAGPGEEVVISSDGEYTRKLVGSDQTPVRWSVIGIRD